MEEVFDAGYGPLVAGGAPLVALGLAVTDDEARLTDVETVLVQQGKQVHEGHDPCIGRVTSLVVRRWGGGGGGGGGGGVKDVCMNAGRKDVRYMAV